jgi:hypothetical protein
VGEAVMNVAGEGKYFVVNIYEFIEGLVVRVDLYFTSSLPSPEYHTPWAERD